MKPSIQITPQRVFIYSITFALVIIILGSLFALNTTPNSLANLGSSLLHRMAFLTHSNLVVKIDHTKLAANGTSQTTVTASHPYISSPITASVISGSGTINKLSQTKGKASFTYTSGTQPGTVEIMFRLNNIEEIATLELLEAVAPASPQILNPPTNSSTNLLKPEIVGTGPVDTRITISNNGQINTTTRTNANGVFRVKLERALTNGDQTLTATAISDLDIASQPSAPVLVKVEAEPLKYDANNIRFSPDKILAGSSFAPFIPVSLNTEKVLIELEGSTYQLSDPNDVSIFSRSLPAPAQPGSYSATLILVDAADIPTRFEGALQFSVVTP